MDWYWRFMMGLPPRLEDRLELGRIAPELFGPDRNHNDVPDGEPQERLHCLLFLRDLRRWLRTDDPRPHGGSARRFVPASWLSLEARRFAGASSQW